MQRINIYIPEELNKKLDFMAAYAKKAKAEVIRDALAEGVRVTQPKSESAKALLDMAKACEKIPTKGILPKDIVENMDFYMWGGEKHNE